MSCRSLWRLWRLAAGGWHHALPRRLRIVHSAASNPTKSKSVAIDRAGRIARSTSPFVRPRKWHLER